MVAIDSTPPAYVSNYVFPASVKVGKPIAKISKLLSNFPGMLSFSVVFRLMVVVLK